MDHCFHHLLIWQVLRVYSKPPLYDAKLLRTGLRYIYACGFLHAGLGWWAYSQTPSLPLRAGAEWERPGGGGGLLGNATQLAGIGAVLTDEVRG